MRDLDHKRVGARLQSCINDKYEAVYFEHLTSGTCKLTGGEKASRNGYKYLLLHFAFEIT